MKAFLVEGRMEKAIVERLCPGTPVRLIGANGDNVAIETIAKFVAAQAEFLINRYFPIYVIFDRERRPARCEEIIVDLFTHLQHHGIHESQLRIIVADRTTEAWFLPFLQDDGTLADLQCRTGCEGLHAKADVKQVFRSLGKNYIETIHGVDLFCGLDPRLAVTSSPSFRRLVDALTDDCWWAFRPTNDSL